MKYKRHHILSILIIIFMLLMAVATSRKSPVEIKNSISYETRGEYILIKKRNEILKHENPGIKSIYLNSDDGKYLREIYYE